MHDPITAIVSGWETFYVILGSSAAALTGLMFVVIALTGEARRVGLKAGVAAIRAFATPIIVHFGGVLLLAAVLTTPAHTLITLSVSLAGCGVGGLGFVRWVAIQTRRQQDYQPVDEDYEWHITLPAVVYGAVVFGGVGLWWRPIPALTLVGAAALFLLYIGIRNAWDSAIYLSVGLPAQPPPPQS